MNTYNKIKRKYYKRYSTGLEMIVNEAKNKKELMERKAAWAEELRARFEEEVKDLPKYMKRETRASKWAAAVEVSYANAVNNIIAEEPKSRKVINERIKSSAQIAESAYKAFESAERRKKRLRQRILVGGAAALMLAGTIFAATTIGGGQDKNPQKDNAAVVDTIPSEPQGGDQETLKMPDIVSYDNANGTFQYLYNTVDVNYWAYETVANELQEYNKAHPDNAYQIDMGLLNGAVLCGIQLRESSCQLNANNSNPDYQGPFSIPTNKKNVEEINNVAKRLTGENLIDLNNIKNNIQDPRIGAKACAYYMIQNYEYLKAILPEGVEITQNILIDSYLYGASGVKDRIISGEYNGKKAYSSRICEYAEVYEEYKEELDKHPEMRGEESTAAGRAAYKKLNQITEKYSNSDQDQRDGGSASEMD